MLPVRTPHGVMIHGFVALCLVGCVSPSDGQFTCPNPGDPCPSGQRCFGGVCMTDGAEPRDAGPGDAGPETADAGPDGGEMADGGVDAGVRPCDEDEDGVCPGDSPPDCDDTRAHVSPSLLSDECQGFFGDGEGRDNDCDGLIDEGCDATVGVVHLPIRLHATGEAEPSLASFRSPELSADGTSLYFVRELGGISQVQVASRVRESDNTFGEFAAPSAVPDTGGILVSVGVFSLTADELRLVYDTASASRLRMTSRASRTDPFEAPEFITPPSLAIGQPSISRDGAELVAVEGGSGTHLVHLRFVGEVWSAPVVIPGTVGASEPRLSADGHTLLFRQGGAFHARSRRDRAQAFDDSDEALDPELVNALDLLGADVHRPAFHPETRELWFSREATNSLEAPLLNGSMWRAHLCRSGNCEAPLDACEGIAQPRAVSQDGLHCFYATQPMNALLGAATCASNDHVAASIHTAQETTAVQALCSLGPAGVFIGYHEATQDGPFQWLSGEPNLGGRLDTPGQPTRLDYAITCGQTAPSDWNPEPNGTSLPTLCEAEIWPTWPALRL